MTSRQQKQQQLEDQQSLSTLRETVGFGMLLTLQQVCGGNCQLQKDKTTTLRDLVMSSISFPNKTNTNNNNHKNNNDPNNGKPHDIEVKIALVLFHRWKKHNKITGENNNNHNNTKNNNVVTVISDFGVTRNVTSPWQLAQWLCLPLEDYLREQGTAHHVQANPSGIIYIVTKQRSKVLQLAGKLPCPHCVQWCRGQKGLWWHQQMHHQIEHSQATANAQATCHTLAMIVYNPNPFVVLPTLTLEDEKKISFSSSLKDTAGSSNNDPYWDWVKNGNVQELQSWVQTTKSDVANLWDHRGATPLMWAAGSGQLEMAKYLVETCHVNVNQPQRGKRSFRGRTALHWASRNGHFHVVQYLVLQVKANVLAATVDGTTAFGWASWQGHLSIMKFLSEQGCDIHTINSFGCNAVLWCAQGNAESGRKNSSSQNDDDDNNNNNNNNTLSAIQWLHDKKCNMTLVNHNGHGVLHKAAQRGHDQLAAWFISNILLSNNTSTDDDDDDNDTVRLLRLVQAIGPDAEGYCPSDLAGMEGYHDLAQFLANQEMQLISNIFLQSQTPIQQDQASSSSSSPCLSKLPSWLVGQSDSVDDSNRGDRVVMMHQHRPLSEQELMTWEKGGGMRRMRSQLACLSRAGI